MEALRQREAKLAQETRQVNRVVKRRFERYERRLARRTRAIERRKRENATVLAASSAGSAGAVSGGSSSGGSSSGGSSSGSGTPSTAGAQLVFTNDATNGWGVEWGSDATVSPGTSGLVLGLTGSGYPGIDGTAGLSTLAPGATVTYQIDDPSGTPIQVVPFAQDSAWAVHFAPATTLAGGWNTVSWVVPAETGITAIGLQVDDSANWSGQLVLASAGW